MPRIVYTTIASGFNVSDDVDVSKGPLLGVALPVVTSGFLALQGNLDTTSANFKRLAETRTAPGSDLLFPTAAGSKMLMIPPTIVTPPYVRLEIVTAGSLQSDTRTFACLVT